MTHGGRGRGIFIGHAGVDDGDGRREGTVLVWLDSVHAEFDEGHSRPGGRGLG